MGSLIDVHQPLLANNNTPRYGSTPQRLTGNGNLYQVRSSKCSRQEQNALGHQKRYQSTEKYGLAPLYVLSGMLLGWVLLDMYEEPPPPSGDCRIGMWSLMYCMILYIVTGTMCIRGYNLGRYTYRGLPEGYSPDEWLDCIEENFQRSETRRWFERKFTVDNWEPKKSTQRRMRTFANCVSSQRAATALNVVKGQRNLHTAYLCLDTSLWLWSCYFMHMAGLTFASGVREVIVIADFFVLNVLLVSLGYSLYRLCYEMERASTFMAMRDRIRAQADLIAVTDEKGPFSILAWWDEKLLTRVSDAVRDEHDFDGL